MYFAVLPPRSFDLGFRRTLFFSGTLPFLSASVSNLFSECHDIQDIIVHRFLYHGPPTSASTPLSVPSPRSVLSNRISELFSSSPIPPAFFCPPPLFTLHEFTDWLLDAVVFTLDPLNNPNPFRIRIGFNRSDLGLNPTPRLTRILGSAPDQKSPVVSSLFPLVTMCCRSPFVLLSTTLCLFLGSDLVNLCRIYNTRGVPAAATRLSFGNSKFYPCPSEPKCGWSWMCHE